MRKAMNLQAIVTDVTAVDLLHLAISCLTGIGALVLIAILLFVAWLMAVIHGEKPKKLPETGPLVEIDWEQVLEEVQK
jgi:hypothetical protein